VSAQLRQHWTEAGAQNLAQQQQICETLARTAQEISAQAEAHARSTVGEVAAWWTPRPRPRAPPPR
jgi:hypothetical protein